MSQPATRLERPTPDDSEQVSISDRYAYTPRSAAPDAERLLTSDDDDEEDDLEAIELGLTGNRAASTAMSASASSDRNSTAAAQGLQSSGSRGVGAAPSRGRSAVSGACLQSRICQILLGLTVAAIVLGIGIAIGRVIEAHSTTTTQGGNHNTQPDPNAFRGVLLISIDGFRAEYLDRGLTPTMKRLASQGVRAQGTVTCFPSKTFPNHISLVTGLLPDVHGIVDNTFYDPVLNQNFRYSDPAVNREPRWWLAEPLWITAERQGVTSGTWYWPGSEVFYDGNRRATYLTPFANGLSNAARIDGILGWLDLPAIRRPSFVALYLSSVDSAGHSFGPDSGQVNNALVDVDSAIDRLLDGLASRNLDQLVDVVLVSDHGMTATSASRVILLDSFIDLTLVRVISTGSHSGLIVQDEALVPEIVANLTHVHPYLHAYARKDIPARFQYGNSPRVPSVFVMVDIGWTVTTQAIQGVIPGNHGFDNQEPDMHGLFIASGPSFRARAGTVVASPSILDVYPLVGRLLNVTVLPHNGTDQLASLVAF
ncbi:type I phosphodiesterase/nucleotide pyrophosphatase [Capsaspora owczarzaki ATCC 30864]|uniref:Type I phosphodiesterase/nucleotide pyrophosphatase n=1 Tax=Capsaspora owczarzaki (strain ATCC 30864) TaxID=595528 RepID=A0A0D2U9G6_CAPO3|nr:type I phosphodiesterase/nucleotide pyrophosphatase [Capsaspora owczarzaki ATCC 30864]